jgi:DNA repair exonuclease SbcCD nuclease subunit
LKIAIITDTHAGARNDSLAMDTHMREFFTDTFFPTLEREGIDTVFHLGDAFDKRKGVNFQTLKSVKDYFFDPCWKKFINLYIVPGNHDTYFKNTNNLNALDLLLDNYNNIQVFYEPLSVTYNHQSILFVPWICDENRERVLKVLEETNAQTCFGHFEIKGFDMHRGMKSESGFDASDFAKFDRVFSGHYHSKNDDGHIHYLGSPYQMTWSDYDDPRGFHIYDTDTGALTFIVNPKQMFNKVYYDDRIEQKFSFKELAGTYVKLIVVHKTDFFKFDKVVDSIQKSGVVELKIIEDKSLDVSDADADETVDVEDTMTLLSAYVDSVDSGTLNPFRLKNTLKTLFVEAQHREK